MNRLSQVRITQETSIIQAIQVIDHSTYQIALVLDNHGRLLGTVTDGDIRRGILRGVSLDGPVRQVMCITPTVALATDPKDMVLATMKAKLLQQIPVVDETGRVVGLDLWEDLIQNPPGKENVVVLMAGGLGSRLGELTKSCPKPMLKVGGRPLIETILRSCKEAGFKKFYISVNFMANILRDYFRDGSDWGVEIEYLVEEERLGTAGALGLLPVRPELPLLVMNGDLLTKVSLPHLLQFHHEQGSAATMCVKQYDFSIPYGVIQIQNHRISKIEEKPSYNIFVNAGIYVLNSSVLDLIPSGVAMDMTQLFEAVIDSKQETSAFPIREYWIDIGKTDDFHRANGEYSEIFE